jgi:hypothetical protein
MGDKKSFGSTVLGWFVVREDAPAKQESADELIAKYASQEPAPPPPEVKLAGELPRATGGNVDYAAVYRAAGIAEEEQGRVDKAMGLLKNLPAETPKEVKKQIVEASLKAFGYPVEQIIEAGAQEIQALEVYIQAQRRDTQALLAQSQERLTELEAEMARVRQLMENEVTNQKALEEASNQQKLQVQEVLEFFGQEAVARVVQQSPKLHEPNRS